MNAFMMDQTTPYRVLARKYRPQNFETLIGQQAMVRTLSNAFTTGRIAQAYMLTGVRGVGKTTTARILARALNFERKDGTGSPTVDLREEGVHCRAILESRHVDVMEMDAASHTGIDDVREMIDAANYKPASARYKVYIIDEVHMLSTAAFNGLLKTLEEPPPHVKFVFATTEINKVPVTVLSRCQRFDLRRIEGDELARHLAGVLASENIECDPEALNLLAGVAEGSVRDALSLLDQAIAYAGDKITTETVAAMLGLADRSQTILLLEHILHARCDEALNLFAALYDKGADPVQMVQALARHVHAATKIKAAPSSIGQAGLPQAMLERLQTLSTQIPLATLSRLWQMLLKGLQEIQSAPNPRMATEMLLIRLTHASEWPDPLELAKKLLSGTPMSASTPPVSGGGAAPSPRQNASLAYAPAPSSAPEVRASAQPALKTLEDVVALADQHRDLILKAEIERSLRLVRLEQGQLEIALENDAKIDLPARLAAALQKWTGQRWLVTLSKEQGQAPIMARKAEQEEQKLAAIHAHPLVREALSVFENAKIERLIARSKMQDEPLSGQEEIFDPFMMEEDEQ